MVYTIQLANLMAEFDRHIIKIHLEIMVLYLIYIEATLTFRFKQRPQWGQLQENCIPVTMDGPRVHPPQRSSGPDRRIRITTPHSSIMVCPAATAALTGA